MSRAVVRTPLAVTSDGEVLLNVGELDVRHAVNALVRLAKAEPGAVFIGVVLGRREVQRLLRDVRLILPNATLKVVGRRIGRRRGAKSPR
jgi:hypothetical protein